MIFIKGNDYMSDVAEVQVTPVYSTIDEVMTLLQNPEEFEKYFKKKAHSEQLGNGEWKRDEKINGFRLTLPDGSAIRLKFFDTIKLIFNSKNVEVPGRESFLSYIDVAIQPAGAKGYQFLEDVNQHVMAYSKGRRPAKDSHAESIAKLIEKAALFGIDLTVKENWNTYFAKHFQK